MPETVLIVSYCTEEIQCEYFYIFLTIVITFVPRADTISRYRYTHEPYILY